MSAVPKQFITPEEYLAIERKADFRSEYWNGEMFAMAGAKYEHSLVKDNLARETGLQLKAGPCQVVTSDLRVKVSDTGLYTYPDIVILCSEPKFEDSTFDTLLNPQVLVEVLSDSTERYDRGAKFKHYRQIHSLREYILVAQDQMLLERYVRQSDDSWLLTVFSDPAKPFEYATVSARILLADIYRGVTLPDQPAR